MLYNVITVFYFLIVYVILHSSLMQLHLCQFRTKKEKKQNTTHICRHRPFWATQSVKYLEACISPSSVFLFLSSPQSDRATGQVPTGGAGRRDGGAGVPCLRKAQAHHPVVTGW